MPDFEPSKAVIDLDLLNDDLRIREAQEKVRNYRALMETKMILDAGLAIHTAQTGFTRTAIGAICLHSFNSIQGEEGITMIARDLQLATINAFQELREHTNDSGASVGLSGVVAGINWAINNLYDGARKQAISSSYLGQVSDQIETEDPKAIESLSPSPYLSRLPRWQEQTLTIPIARQHNVKWTAELCTTVIKTQLFSATGQLNPYSDETVMGMINALSRKPYLDHETAGILWAMSRELDALNSKNTIAEVMQVMETILPTIMNTDTNNIIKSYRLLAEMDGVLIQ